MSDTTKAKTQAMYLHTINGRPASYSPGSGIFYQGDGPYARKGAVLCKSLSEIREQQRASDRWRKEKGYEINTATFTPGWCRVEVAR